MKMKRIIYGLTIAFATMTSCNYLDVEPPGKVIPDETSEFRAMLTSAYSKFPTHKRLLTVRSDEMYASASGLSFNEFLDIALWKDNSNDPLVPEYPWTQMYNVIFYANSVIQDVMNSTDNTDNIEDSKEQLLSEAYLLRAYAHFELANLYAVPYTPATATTDKGIPMQLRIDIAQDFTRPSVEDNYKQILSDIEKGLELSKMDEQDAERRYQFSKHAGLALKARVLLYKQDWKGALEVAQELLPSVELEDLNDAEFTMPNAYNSKESILALENAIQVQLYDDCVFHKEYVDQVYNLSDGADESLRDLRRTTYLRQAGDGVSFAIGKAYSLNGKVTFRASEIYIIAAEAAANLGQVGVASQYLKELTEMRLTPALFTQHATALDAMNKEQMIAEIAQERSRELIAEGHRWYDLRRTTRPEINKVIVEEVFGMIMNTYKGTLKHNDPRYVIAFPKVATENNPELLK